LFATNVGPALAIDGFMVEIGNNPYHNNETEKKFHVSKRKDR
jgi:hypothetical protein